MDDSLKSITYKALSLHGWNVAASHATAGSKVAMDEISEFASFPVRPLFTFTAFALTSPANGDGKKMRSEAEMISSARARTVGNNVSTGRPEAL
jgi:hypothetical protein